MLVAGNTTQLLHKSSSMTFLKNKYISLATPLSMLYKKTNTEGWRVLR